jgi:hypothetical protein
MRRQKSRASRFDPRATPDASMQEIAGRGAIDVRQTAIGVNRRAFPR